MNYLGNHVSYHCDRDIDKKHNKYHYKCGTVISTLKNKVRKEIWQFRLYSMAAKAELLRKGVEEFKHKKLYFLVWLIDYARFDR